MADLSFDVSNPQTPNAGPVIYISSDADKWGRLTVTLTNTRSDNADIKLEPGDVLQIYFEMLTLADIKRIAVPESAAWTGGPDATGGHIELHPKSAINIPSKTSISLELHNVLGETPRSGKFRFFYPSLGIRNLAIQSFVQRPPADGAKQWGLAWLLDPRADYQNQGNTVYVTAPGKPDIANYLLVHLYRSAGGTLSSAGTPKVSFSFLTGDGDLALCSEDRLKKVAASIAHQLPAGRWKDPVADSQGDDIVWTVQPTDGGGDLFPEDGLLTLRFDNIVTDLPPGDAVMFIQYSGLSGYDDGYIQVPLNKTAPVPYVRDCHAELANQLGEIAYPVILHWDVFAAEDCEVGFTGQPTGPFPPIGSATFIPTVAEPSFIIIARVNDQDYSLPARRFRLAKPSAWAEANERDEANVLFTVTLNWRAINAASCNVAHSEYGFISSDLSGSWQIGSFIHDLNWEMFVKPFTVEVTNPAGRSSISVKVPR